jgi:WD40 repeat protein
MGMEKNLLGASWDSDGKRIAAASGDGTVMVWSSETGKLAYKLPGHKGTVNCAEFSPGDEPIRKCFDSHFRVRKLTRCSTFRIIGPHDASRRAKMSGISDSP